MILVDSNVLLDIITVDPKWSRWSLENLASLVENHELIINDIVYSEISVAFSRIEELEEILDGKLIVIKPIPREALFLAGKAFLKYKTLGGTKKLVLPDFFIGAHAVVLDIPLITRDTKRYKTYFPNIDLISPLS